MPNAATVGKMFDAFKGERGNFTVCVDGETWNSLTMVYGLENPDVFGVAHKEPIDWRLDEKNHSPTGLEWGYGGSGPTQLAYCLLRECGLTQPQASKLYVKFKQEVVASLPKEFYITRAEIMKWVQAQ